MVNGGHIAVLTVRVMMYCTGEHGCPIVITIKIYTCVLFHCLTSF